MSTAGSDSVGALALAAALRAGERDAREVAEQALRAAHTAPDGPAAYVHVLEDLTRRQAEQAQEELEAARRRGPEALDTLAAQRPLLGVPLPIKDLSRIAGEPWTAGSAVMVGSIADVTDGVAQRILDAGTLTVGKTSVPEFGMPCYTEPALGAPARTPWDRRRTAGGSSGGAAVAVSAGLVPLAHGSDGGGSVRIPAACCGLLGMKPSRGLVSTGPHSTEGPGLVADGMLARSVADLAAGLDLITGARPGDSLPAQRPARPLREAVGRVPGPLRIGVLTAPLNIDTDVHPAALRGVERAVKVLRGLGHAVTEVGAPFTPQQWRAFMPLWTTGAAAIPVPPEAEEHLLALTRWLRAEGRAVTGVELAQAQAGMQTVARRVGEAFAELDVVLTPSLSGPPAFPEDLQLADGAADFDAQCAFTPWTSTWNMTGQAAITVPLHREEIEGTVLPFGVHLGAVRFGSDALLLSLAAQLEAVDPWPLLAP